MQYRAYCRPMAPLPPVITTLSSAAASSGRLVAESRHSPEGSDVTPRRFAAPQRDLGRLTEQHVDDGARRPGIDVSAREVEMPEGLVGEFEADAAMHRGQRRLRRWEAESSGSMFSAPAVSSQTARHRRADQRGVVG